ncbi:MAG TPA: flagellar filament capping protein FliD [Nitrosomonas sp.]|nr:flagellar filament capping protein FliD [Nitrosomonas sp.]HQX12572.1 flagellar filament capping protein FliD [Nitrosomonas sp.]HRB32180.1 flagellar filament capping protein FliD [Nitrosomonas sp.]HRB44842.1 flagellar filament capping protein FliD [Nitrosomonas sp.]HRB77113.1 flagellar filament capping protein FliD [Nitrosomonas sp.]
MPALTSPGIGSGLDVNGIVKQLMALENRPLAALDVKEAKQQTRLTAFGTLKGALSSFQGSVAALSNPAKFNGVTAGITDATLASVSATSSAVTGSHSLEVQTLAQAQKLKSANFATTSENVGSGTLTIQFGTYSGGSFTLNSDKAAQSITIALGNSSLAGIRDAINQADAGVTASIVNDGSGNRLVIASKDTGLSNALKITAIDNDGNNNDNAGLSQLVYDASTGGTSNLSETVTASNANFIIDGIAISKSSNKVTDALEGVTIDLLKASPGTTTTLNLARDTAGIQGAVNSFVKAFNDLNKTIVDLSKYDAATKQASILTGDSTVRSLQTSLRNEISNPLTTAGGGLSLLSDIGISFQADGTLKLDQTKLTKVLVDPTKDISTLFASVGKTTDSQVSFVSATSDTLNGKYSLDITQMATQGSALGGAAAALTINSGSNDTLDLSIHGVSTSISIAAGTYTASSLAAEIQSKINGSSAIALAGLKVSVTESAGVLKIASNQYGAASTVSITGGNGKASLFGTPVETAGLDVAGSINGITATGSGQTLTGQGSSNGLVLKINGGSTGSRGDIDFAHGFAAKLDKVIDRMLDTHLIDSRIDGINSTIKDIGSQREVLSRRLVDVEKRIRTQFSALDSMVASMTQTSNFLQQQLSKLPTIR